MTKREIKALVRVVKLRGSCETKTGDDCRACPLDDKCNEYVENRKFPGGDDASPEANALVLSWAMELLTKEVSSEELFELLV